METGLLIAIVAIICGGLGYMAGYRVRVARTMRALEKRRRADRG